MLNPREYAEFISKVHQLVIENLNISKEDFTIKVAIDDPVKGIIFIKADNETMLFTGTEALYDHEAISVGFYHGTVTVVESAFLEWEKVVASMRLSVYEIWKLSTKEKYTRKKHRQMLEDHGHIKIMT